MFDGCIINISWINVNKRHFKRNLGLAVIKTVRAVKRTVIFYLTN